MNVHIFAFVGVQGVVSVPTADPYRWGQTEQCANVYVVSYIRIYIYLQIYKKHI